MCADVKQVGEKRKNARLAIRPDKKIPMLRVTTLPKLTGET